MLGYMETVINRSENYTCYDFCDTIENTIFDGTMGGLYRYGLSEHGRCIGKMYVGDGKHVGYVFVKRRKYDDCAETFLAEAWVSMGEYHPAQSEHLTY